MSRHCMIRHLPPPRPLGRSARVHAKAPLQTPVERTGAPLVEECREQENDENAGTGVAAPAEVVERHRPGDHEDRLQVEDHEEHRDEIELDGQPHVLGIAHRDNAGFERHRAGAAVACL